MSTIPDDPRGPAPVGPAPATPVAPVPALQLGGLTVWPPVVLAPMAGVTNAAFRQLCRRHGGGLFVSEMVGARALLEGDERTALKAAFAPDESPRSIQLYATEARDAAAAATLLRERGAVDHIDLNFGCPSPKVTRHGGGAALPWHRRRYAAIVQATVAAAGEVPVTVKLRLGLDAAHLTYRDAGRIAADLGVAAITLHARTAEQRYSPPVDRAAIAELAADVAVPVLGNGDVWEAADARSMLAETGCAGVVIGRGCLGRPWLFAELQAAFAGRPLPPPPDLGGVAALLREHATLLAAHLGTEVGIRELRRHTGWYLQGFAVGGAVRRALNQVRSLAELDALLASLPADLPFDESVRRSPRGHTDPPRRVVLPHGWLDRRDPDAALDPAAAAVVGGG